MIWLLRKMRSAFLRLSYWLSSVRCYAQSLGNPALTIDKDCHFGKAVRLLATDGGSISLGKGVYLADHVQIVAQGGRVVIGEGVFIGIGSMLYCSEKVTIGKDSMVSEYVVIRDQDHRTDSIPIRDAGFHITPIHIGQNVWIGCKASVLRGAVIGDRCVIGAHALVKSSIEEGKIAVGLPARVIGII